MSLTTSLRTTVRFGHPPPLSRRRIVQKPPLGPACKYQSHEGQSITRISPAKPEQLPRGSERGSLQSPCATSRGIRQLCLGPTLKKTRQTNRGSIKKSRILRKKLLYAGTRNSYKPLERVKLDTLEGTKNNLAVNLIPQSNSW